MIVLWLIHAIFDHRGLSSTSPSSNDAFSLEASPAQQIDWISSVCTSLADCFFLLVGNTFLFHGAPGWPSWVSLGRRSARWSGSTTSRFLSSLKSKSDRPCWRSILPALSVRRGTFSSSEATASWWRWPGPAARKSSPLAPSQGWTIRHILSYCSLTFASTDLISTGSERYNHDWSLYYCVASFPVASAASAPRVLAAFSCVGTSLSHRQGRCYLSPVCFRCSKTATEASSYHNPNIWRQPICFDARSYSL